MANRLTELLAAYQTRDPAARSKLEIFLPEDHFDPICQALWSVDAGHIGQYDRCLSWSRAFFL